MMNLNHTVIQNIIKDIEKSIEYHNIAIGDEDCFKNDVGEANCHHCQLSELIDDLDCLKSNLEPIAKNTINNITFIDLESFCYSIGKQHNVDEISIEPIWPDPNSELNPDSNKPIGLQVFIRISRVAMDSMGGIEGTETNTFVWQAIDKRELGICGIPYLLSKWVVNPDQFELCESNYPDEWTPDHDPECESIENPDWDCDCGAIEGGYYHPPEDFVYEEMGHIIEFTNWIEAEFDPDTRIWKLGYNSYDMNEFQNNSDYAESVKEDDGNPSFGHYC